MDKFAHRCHHGVWRKITQRDLGCSTVTALTCFLVPVTWSAGKQDNKGFVRPRIQTMPTGMCANLCKRTRCYQSIGQIQIETHFLSLCRMCSGEHFGYRLQGCHLKNSENAKCFSDFKKLKRAKPIRSIVLKDLKDLKDV